MSMNKICIIGGGPAGLSSAIKAAESGFDVKLYEMGEIGDNVRCAEGFIDTLNLLEKPEAGIRFKVKEMLVRCSDETYKLDVSPIRLWMIDRREWQRHLADKARSLGVEILENYPVTPDILKKMKDEYLWIIDGSGVIPVTSRLYNFQWFYTKNCGVTFQYLIEGDFTFLHEKILAGLEPRYTGYYWIFPKGTYQANVGIGILKYEGQVLRHELDRILEKEGLTRDYGYTIKQAIGGLCPNVIPHKVVYDNIILIGDACGLTSPFHGGGIDLACISGKVAVEAVLEERVDTYKQELLKIIGDKLSLEQELVNFWEAAGFELVNRLLKRFSKYKKFPYLIMNPAKYSQQLITLLKILKNTEGKSKRVH
ncbi:MAG TPA: NAD(P)/FAD-dependent oxidoreductase [Thermoanaerobacterales bacterium]|nr:NAD(P)/FAD-dependent oxidoreductase [Thermoanaerobacterales bacterium]